MTPAEFARECDRTAKALRRLPRDLRRALAQRTKAEVAEPLAAKIRTAGRGVYGPRVAATTRTRAAADPTVVIGGARRVVSGGARGRDLVFGTEFGGHTRITAVPARAGRAGYRRRSTRQFARGKAPFVFRTVAANAGRALQDWAGIVDDVVDGSGVTRGS